ncbi:uncharacterized protein LOC116298542 isoform X2 [Actinia tenebrosa]|uniref:Uncharacterized protein LOC116298542 isoform X2 n=1 Tax=Actinia tenebrosa TaxID=6105 RepID=A0A6P8I2Y1_ACTTE|nr:uncharacterized protein LOC116298542 isoform X2 [Actinia tenebrosa]
MSSIEDYRFMLLEISHQVRLDELEGMRFLCVDFIPDCRREDTKGTLHFFRELEMQNKLGIDNLDWLISMLKHLKREDLVLKLTGFQVQRNFYLRRLCSHQRASLTPTQETINSREVFESYSASHYHSVNQPSAYSGSDRQPGEFALRCILRLATTGAWLGGSAYLLNRYKDDPEALVTMVTGVVLPTGVMVRYVTSGSIKMMLWATDLYALNDLWKRYKTGQLREDLEKVLVTEELKEQAEGEQIEFSVEIDEQEYRYACMDLVIAQKQAEQSYHNSLLSSRRRSRSVDSLTSLRLQEMSRDLNCPAHPETNQKRVSILNTKSVAICSRQSSFGSETSDDEGSFQLLRDFLEISGKARDVCSLLDRPMVICNDWRNLASEFSYKMIHIRLWERNHSPCMTLLENITLRDPDTRVSKLIDKLSAIDRHDVIRLIQGREPKSDPRTVWHFPFSTRKQLSFELDNATKEQFHFVVSDIFKNLEASKIESLSKRPSPTMALLEELETMCPCLPMFHVRDACYRAKVYGAVKIMDSHIRKKSFQGKISSHRNLFEHVGSDESKSVGSLSRDSAIEQDLMEQEGS